MEITRGQVLAHRLRAQELDRQPGDRTDAAVLDAGVQDTGTDGARWALEVRGARPDQEALVTAWTLRGAPHVYRRSQVAEVATAVAPWSEADAAKRVFDAATPLRKAGISVLDALDRIAREMSEIARKPVPKGEMSSELHRRLPPPYQRWCRSCGAEHPYEQPFRLAALRAGLELRPGTSPPVLERIPDWRGAATAYAPQLDPVRAVLHLLGPATPKQVAEYVDAPVADVRARWPEDVEPVTVEGQERSALVDDLASLAEPVGPAGPVRLLGPFDLYLQARDRQTVVPEEPHRQELWRTLGRPGAVLVGHEVHGTWRPRASGGRLRLAVDAWAPMPELGDEGERLAAFRGLRFDGFVE